MLLTSADRQGRHRLAGLGDLSIVIIAATGLSLFWSQCSYLSGVSRWYHSAQQLRATGVGPKADFDLTTFPWHVANARVFDVVHDRITIVTSSEPFGYQAVATVSADGARAADFQFDIEVEKGGGVLPRSPPRAGAGAHVERVRRVDLPAPLSGRVRIVGDQRRPSHRDRSPDR